MGCCTVHFPFSAITLLSVAAFDKCNKLELIGGHTLREVIDPKQSCINKMAR